MRREMNLDDRSVALFSLVFMIVIAIATSIPRRNDPRDQQHASETMRAD